MRNKKKMSYTPIPAKLFFNAELIIITSLASKNKRRKREKKTKKKMKVIAKTNKPAHTAELVCCYFPQ